MCEEQEKLNNKLTEQLLDCNDKLANLRNESDLWINSLKELGEIQDAFKINEKSDLRGKTILDVGTDAVKPLYIAIKFKPSKIVGISEELPRMASDIMLKSRLFTETKIGFYDCSFFNEVTFNKIREKEEIKDKFDFILISKTLHHLRDGKCVKKHEHREDEKCCKYEFNTEKIFSKLLELGKRVIIYEWFYPEEEDDDKVRGRGGYFTTKEWVTIFDRLKKKYLIEFIRPQFNEKMFKEIRQVLKQEDYMCFYVEKQE